MTFIASGDGRTFYIGSRKFVAQSGGNPAPLSPETVKHLDQYVASLGPNAIIKYEKGHR